jgi:hypothetical protein
MQDGTFENLLAAEGIPASAVKGMLRQLVSWKVLRGGRALLDRNRRFTITKNLSAIIDLLVEVCVLVASCGCFSCQTPTAGEYLDRDAAWYLRPFC